MNKVIFLLPDINGEMHAIKEKNVERLVKSKGGPDVIVYHQANGYAVTKLPIGTIDRYFGAKRWAALIE